MDLGKFISLVNDLTMLCLCYWIFLRLCFIRLERPLFSCFCFQHSYLLTIPKQNKFEFLMSFIMR